MAKTKTKLAVFDRPEIDVNAGVAGKVGRLLPWRKGKRSGLFYRLVRNRAAEQIVAKHGVSEEEAHEFIDGVTEREMDELADAGKVGDLGDGSLLQKIIDFITSPQFLQLIEALMKLFLLFAAKKKANQ